ncbi:MAG TPA: hypothetical protein GXZ43_04830 [Clostridiaceae bacterium]|nr:hypothetical protein [Clostridiaceae bacterium]
MSIRKINLPANTAPEDFNKSVDSGDSPDTVDSGDFIDSVDLTDSSDALNSVRSHILNKSFRPVKINQRIGTEASEKSRSDKKESVLNNKNFDQPSEFTLNVRRIQNHQKKNFKLRRPAKFNATKTTYERLSDLSLSQLTVKAKEFHALPRERQMKINPAHRNWIIAQIRKANSEDKLYDLAFSLNHKELSLLFPVLATTSKPSTRDKLKTLILLRANKSLYFHGWLTWQFIYPDNRLAKTIAELCKILSEQQFPAQNKIAGSLIKTKRKISVLPYPHFNWPQVKMISEISMPDSRRFMNNVLTYLLQNDISLEKFFSEYAIYDDLALGEAFKANYEVERIEYKFKAQDEKFSWQSLLRFGSKDNVLEE